MLKLITAATALAFATSYAAAQTSTPTGATQQNAPNSGAGIPGQPGNKSGPSVRPPSATTGSGTSSGAQTNEGRTLDASKIPGQSGNKSGPAARPPAGQTSK
jgi:hypothetical protein